MAPPTQNQNKLLKLLEFEGLQTESDLVLRLATLGKHLFYRWRISANGKIHQITGIELYLRNHNVINDPIAHAKEEQLRQGHFYVHRYQNFKAPFRSGLDITCGNAEKRIYGGLLIREINHIDGPSKALIVPLFCYSDF